MSSTYVRTQIKNFITANIPGEIVVDLTATFGDIRTVLKDSGINSPGPWLGLQFVGSDEIPITIGAGNTTGKYRETGLVYLHVVGVAKLGAGNAILSRVEIIRNAFRGQRIGKLVVDSVSPPNFEEGATLQFDAGYTSASILIGYESDLDL